MMAGFMALIGNNKLTTALLVLILLLLVALGICHVRINYLNAQHETDRLTIVNLTTANDQLAASIKVQNKAVLKIKADSDARVKAANKAVKAASAKADTFRKRAAQIEAAVVTGDECQQSKAVLNDYYAGAHP